MKLICSNNFTIFNSIMHFITKCILVNFMHKFHHFCSILLSTYSKKVICRYHPKLGKTERNLILLTAMKTIAIFAKIKEDKLKTSRLPGAKGSNENRMKMPCSKTIYHRLFKFMLWREGRF